MSQNGGTNYAAIWIAIIIASIWCICDPSAIGKVLKYLGMAIAHHG
jgi:hypothetical protein